MSLSKISTVVFPVAGLGTRFLPATKAVPKEMLPIVDRPLIQWAVEEAAQAGCTHFVFVSAPEKESIAKHFADAPHYAEQLRAKGKTDALDLLRAGLPDAARVTHILQPEPLGLGHAIWCARDAIEDAPFAVILPDDLVLSATGCLKQMVDAFATIDGNIVAVESISAEHTDRYGIIDPIDTDGDLLGVKGLVEKPAPAHAPSTLGIIGRYILAPHIMDILATTASGAGGEIQLTDALATMLDSTPLYGFRFAGARYDCGSRNGFIAANLAYALSADAAGADAGETDALRQLIAPLFTP